MTTKCELINPYKEPDNNIEGKDCVIVPGDIHVLVRKLMHRSIDYLNAARLVQLIISRHKILTQFYR